MDKTKVLGAHLDEYGAKFSIFSANADRIELVLLDEKHSIQKTIELPIRMGDVWGTYVSGVKSGQRYAYRVHGRWDPDKGHLFNGAKLLLDPYARSISRMPKWDESLFGYDRSQGGRVLNPKDSISHAPIGVVTKPKVSKKSNSRLNIPWKDTVIYETHIKSLSQLHPEVPPSLRGTYLGAASEPVLDHLKRLGVTTIELLPVYAAVQDERLVRNGLSQYWGYNPLSFFAPDSRFSVGGAISAVEEFRVMVDVMHAHGFEVILDVVYNHTGEGDHLGPTLSWRGIDNASYYISKEGQPSLLYDCTGCGNTLRAEHGYVRRLIMDSLRYWVEVMDVDGFRFDLASALLRERRKFNFQSGWLHMMQQDPVLSEVKLIAEPWDLESTGYQLGGYPAPWREWNDMYRDVVRRYWAGEPRISGAFATCVAGSGELFGPGHRTPSSSINYVTSHDGFTLADLVSYEKKHNEGNLEKELDGVSSNYSQNCGEEGDSTNPAVLAHRDRLKRSLLTTLFMSQGVPMLLGGDEFGNSQQGNNNPYCQDNRISWYDWNLIDNKEQLEFVRELIAFRKAHGLMNYDRFLTGGELENGMRDVIWWHPDGRDMESEDWRDIQAFGMWLSVPAILLICFNPTGETVEFGLSDKQVWVWGLGWGESAVVHETGPNGGIARVDSQSVLVLRGHPPVVNRRAK